MMRQHNTSRAAHLTSPHHITISHRSGLNKRRSARRKGPTLTCEAYHHQLAMLCTSPGFLSLQDTSKHSLLVVCSVMCLLSWSWCIIIACPGDNRYAINYNNSEVPLAMNFPWMAAFPTNLPFPPSTFSNIISASSRCKMQQHIYYKRPGRKHLTRTKESVTNKGRGWVYRYELLKSEGTSY